VRTEVDGERRITGIQAPLVWAEAAAAAPPDQQAVTRKQREIRRNQQRRERVRYRLQLVESIGLNTDLSPAEADEGKPHVGIEDRVGAAVAASTLVTQLQGKLDAELRELDRQAQKLAVELQQLSSRPQPVRSDRPMRRVAISLAAGSEHLRALEVSYNVNAARWWPAYSARLSNGGKNAEFSLEAFVAQNTLEDWLDAQVSLCTADMISDITLPELQSLRLGRHQPAKPTGFREPPEGLDAMFAGYDQAFHTMVNLPRAEAPADTRVYAAPSAPPMPQQAPMPATRAPAGMAQAVSMDAVYAEESKADAPRGADDYRREKVGRARSAPAKSAKKEVTRGAEMDDEVMAEMAEEEGYGGGAMSGAAPAESAPEPEPAGVSDMWLNFDSLILGDNSSHRRGRLNLAPQPIHTGGESRHIELLDSPGGAQDPLYARGQFDQRYDADGVIEIPSTGTPHRVRLLARAAASRMNLRCVPIEDERVFREVEINNPLEGALIGGPIDVFMDGALLITSTIGATDRGGVIRFGLGEEQRVRVARNVRAREESKGMFKGGTAMDHDVSIEAASSLPGDVEIEIVDRLPVGDGKDIKVELVSSNPKADKYTQEERHQWVSGGLRWKLPLKAGATAKIDFTYRIGFDKDFELVGGNRRA
jgi:hypothetical protein